MRTKALLVAAHAGARGPMVNLERGVWEIDAHPYVQVELGSGSGKMSQVNGSVRIVGPARIALNVNPKYVGDPIDRQARNVEL